MRKSISAITRNLYIYIYTQDGKEIAVRGIQGGIAARLSTASDTRVQQPHLRSSRLTMYNKRREKRSSEKPRCQLASAARARAHVCNIQTRYSVDIVHIWSESRATAVLRRSDVSGSAQRLPVYTAVTRYLMKFRGHEFETRRPASLATGQHGLLTEQKKKIGKISQWNLTRGI